MAYYSHLNFKSLYLSYPFANNTIFSNQDLKYFSLFYITSQGKTEQDKIHILLICIKRVYNPSNELKISNFIKVKSRKKQKFYKVGV